MLQESFRLLRQHSDSGGGGQPYLPDIRLDHNLPPDIIPESYIDTMNFLRSERWVSGKPVMAIINYHSEAALEIKGEAEEIDLAEILQTEAIQFNPQLESVDFYVIDSEKMISQRLRISFLGGQVHSCRTITVVGDHPEVEMLKQGGESFSFRKECVFVEREDMQRQDQNVSDYQRFVEEFFERHKKKNRRIHAVVSKSNRYAKLPDEMDWHHVGAVREDTNSDLTNTESIYGMSPYLNLVVQEVIKTLDLGKYNIDDVKGMALYLTNGQFRRDAFIADYLGDNHQRSKRVELEYRGEHLRDVAVGLLHQITIALSQSGLSFETVSRRKISPLELG